MIAIISLLMAIALPSVQSARAHAQAMRCAANLRSIGQLIHAFANAHQDCPAPTIWQQDTDWERGPQIGWDIETGRWASIPGGAQSVWDCSVQCTAFVGNARALGVDRREAVPGGELHLVRRNRWHDTSRLVLCYDLQYNVLDLMYAHAQSASAADLSDEYYPWPHREPFTVPLWLPRWGPHDEAYGALFADGHATIDRYDERKAVLWTGLPWWPHEFRASATSVAGAE
ncbi:MAG: DUF1559 domain-containing protein [Planctomycetes bacterium]|nr:DUF1559 domain-containing protein [Planctomycetota bacterium]